MKPSDFIARPCPVPEMLPNSEDFEIHCDHCDKTVTDISYMTANEYKKWRKKNRGACIRLHVERLRVQFYKPKNPKRLVVAMTAVLIASSSGYAELVTTITSQKFQYSNFEGKTAMAAEIMARRAERIGDLFETLKPEPEWRRGKKINGYSGDTPYEEVTHVTF